MPDTSPLFVQRLLWRNQTNPLRGLNIQRAVTALENAERGIYADLQWTYRFVEKRYPVLKAVLERRISALKKLETGVKVKAEITEEDPRHPAALKQKQVLQDAYDGIDNLKEAIEHLAMASFRGYAHLEKWFNTDGDVTHLEPVPQWFWARRNPSMQWLYNWNATSANSGVEIEYQNFVIREIPRPINEPALICFLRRNLAEKDWDGYLQTYGIPPLFLEMPQNAPVNATADYQAVANKVISDGRGSLPHGAKVVSVEPRDRTAPFKEYVDHQEEQVVLAATSGKLSVLNDSTGMGSSQPDQHEDTFLELAEAEAAEISELLRRQFDSFVLKDQPEIMVEFTIAAKDQEDVGQLATNLVSFFQAGLEPDPDEISDKAGITLTKREMTPTIDANGEPTGTPPTGRPLPAKKPTPKPKPGPRRKPGEPGLQKPASGEDINDGTVRVNPNQPASPGGVDRGGPDAYPAYHPYGTPGAAKRSPGGRGMSAPVRNRSSAELDQINETVRKAFALDLKTYQNRLQRILNIQDPEHRNRKLKEFSEQLPKMLADLNQDPLGGEALNRGAMKELLAGLETP